MARCSRDPRGYVRSRRPKGRGRIRRCPVMTYFRCSRGAYAEVAPDGSCSWSDVEPCHDSLGSDVARPFPLTFPGRQH
jgi:hypothetical protein